VPDVLSKARLLALGVIPARGGSKGLARKNLRLVGGESLIAHAIRAACASRRLADWVTSTDDAAIASVASDSGSRVVMRPSAMAADDSPVESALLHAVATVEEGVRRYDAVVLLQPTAPIRTGEDIDAAIAVLEADSEADAVVSVAPAEDAHPARMYGLDGDGRLVSLWPEWASARRQALPAVYHRNGAIYVARRAWLECGRPILAGRLRPYVMPRRLTANIDDERDLAVADLLVTMWKDGRL
jgi:CMP-N-acetylneuraminic acid synthetase